jgi:hypothetical protein
VQIWRFFKTPLQRKNHLVIFSVTSGDLEIFENSTSTPERFVCNFCCSVKIWEIFQNSTSTQERFVYHFRCQMELWRFLETPCTSRENIFNFNSIVMQTSTEMGTAHLLHCSPPEVLNFISLFLIRLFDEINCGVVGKKPRS